MTDAVTLPRPQSSQVVNPPQTAVQPNRPLESRLDRMMFASLGSRPAPLQGFE